MKINRKNFVMKEFKKLNMKVNFIICACVFYLTKKDEIKFKNN